MATTEAQKGDIFEKMKVDRHILGFALLSLSCIEKRQCSGKIGNEKMIRRWLIFKGK